MNGYQDFACTSTFKAQLQKMLGVFDATLLIGIGEDAKKDILSSAEMTLQHDFDLLGSGRVRLDPIDWHTDFKCGAKWDKDYYRDIHTSIGADLKVPWELSRCQHLLWLGEAYLLTKEDKFAQEVIDEICWWIDDNPLMYSVNWKCAMDVAFRAVTWLFVLNMIVEFQGFDDMFANKVARSLWQHAFFINNNLEKQIPYSNNHYLSDIIGLLYLGSLFGESSKGKRLFLFALDEYYSETRRQVLPSGVHYERSLSYHRMMTEMLSYSAYMLRRMGKRIPVDILARIQAMYAFVSTYTKPNGLAPLIADNDDGRFLPFKKRDFRDHNYLNDEDSVENIIIACKEPRLFGSKVQEGCLYQDAGFAVQINKKSYLFVSHSGYSKNPNETDMLIGTHTHNDLLSFEYAFNGKDIVIDPGTFVYTSDRTSRNKFRSTAKHNTVVVDGEEQNLLPKDKMFAVMRNVHYSKLENNNGGIKGSYVTIKGGMSHERLFYLSDNSLIIKDRLEKKGVGHEAIFLFHLADDVEYGRDLTIISSIGEPTVFDYTWSPSYGIMKKSHVVVFRSIFNDAMEADTFIVPSQ
jgi:hypothetical protein